MNRQLARRMDRVVVAWLVEHHQLPPWAEKDRPDWLVQAESRLHRKLQGMFDQALQRLQDEMRRRRFPAGQMQQMELILRHLAPLGELLPDVVWPESQEAAGHSRHSVETDLRQAGWRVSYSPLARTTEELLRQTVFEAGQRTMESITTDAQSIMSTLAGAIRDGAGEEEAARMLRAHLDGLQEHELRTVARTEIHSAAGIGSHHTMLDYGVQFKRWLTALDSDVRTSHSDLHGAVVRVDEPYPNGLMFPGDRSGPIREWINCRCRDRAYLPRRGEVISSTPYYP